MRQADVFQLRFRHPRELRAFACAAHPVTDHPQLRGQRLPLGNVELPLIVSDMSQVTFSVGRGNSAIRGSPGSHNDNTPPNTSSARLHPRATAKACVYAATSCPDPSALKKTPPTIATPSAAPI
jgi:hypothetical protein